MSKEITSISVKWTMPDGATGTQTFNASSLGPTVARQRAAARTVIIHEQGGEVFATEFYKDGSHHTFKNI